MELVEILFLFWIVNEEIKWSTAIGGRQQDTIEYAKNAFGFNEMKEAKKKKNDWKIKKEFMRIHCDSE